MNQTAYNRHAESVTTISYSEYHHGFLVEGRDISLLVSGLIKGFPKKNLGSVIIKLLRLVTAMLLTTTTTFAQWLSMSQSGICSKSQSIETTLMPVVNQDKRISNQFSVKYMNSVKTWKLDFSGSTIEKLYPTGVFYASRRNHFSFDQSLTKSFANPLHATFTVSNNLIWDLSTSSLVTTIVSASTQIAIANGSEIKLAFDHWDDYVASTFALRNLTVPEGRRQFQTLFLRYSSPQKQTFSPYIEACVGNYYTYNRVAFRVGSRVQLSKKWFLFADVEYTKVGTTIYSEEFLTRLKCEWKPMKSFVSSVYLVKNGFLNLSGVFASIAYTRNCHQLKVEYRDLRDPGFDNVVTSNPAFASRLLFQYQYHFAND